MKLQQKTKKTLSATGILVAIVVAVVFFNVIVGAAADKFQLRWDMTGNKIYALTEETKNILDLLEKEVDLFYFASSGHENAQIVRTLDMYRLASDKLKISQEDPNSNPIAMRRFTDKGIPIRQNTIVIEQGERYRYISPEDIYNGYTTQSGNTIENALFSLEQRITRAVAYVSSGKTYRVAMTVGHNETDFSSVATLLNEENIEVYQINLKTEDIPTEFDSVYIMAPSDDFTQDELLKLDAFLSRGKGAHIAFDARKSVLPKLEEYLSAFWGVRVYHDLVCESDSSRTLNYPYMFIPDIGEHSVTENIPAGNPNVIMMYTRSLSFSEVEDVTPAVLTSTTKNAFSVHGSDRTATDNVREGVLPLSGAITRNTKEGYDAGRIVVSGSFQMYDSLFLNEPSFSNRDFLLGTAHFINHNEEETLSVSPKGLFVRMVMISDRMTVFYIIAVCILPPVLFFVLCAWVWKRRRHL